MSKQILSDLDFNLTARARNLLDPTLAQDAATKAYVDAAIEGLAWKDNVRVATQANINLASPGATIDGITMVLNDRVLVKDQTDPAENGIYVYNGPSTPLTRAADGNTSIELESAVIGVDEGTSAGSMYRQTAVNFTIDVDDVLFSVFGAATPLATETVAGRIEIATQSEVDAGASDSLAITPLKLANWSGRVRRFEASIGDGSATSYTVTHNFNTRDVQVHVYRNSGNYDEVITDIEHTSVNSVTIKFAAAPSLNSFRVAVLA